MSILFTLIPSLLAFGPLFLLGLFISYWKKRSATFRKNNPLSRDLFRSPGETIRAEIDEMELDIAGYLTLTTAIPLLLYSTALTIKIVNSEAGLGAGTIIFYTLLGIAAIVYFSFKLITLMKRKRLLTIGFEAELAVGQELNKLVRSGAWVFHDFPADGFNIDHIVVSPKGVLAVETKGRSKPANESGKSTAWDVTYNGTTLAFPGWSETEPLAQAMRQASWLQSWLSSAVGESISAKPILVLPGWYVKRTVQNGIWVCNGSNPQTLIQYGQDVLSPTLIDRIVHQLDQRCRNIKPT